MAKNKAKPNLHSWLEIALNPARDGVIITAVWGTPRHFFLTTLPHSVYNMSTSPGSKIQERSSRAIRRR
jgi:hypothetical protein